MRFVFSVSKYKYTNGKQSIFLNYRGFFYYCLNTSALKFSLPVVAWSFIQASNRAEKSYRALSYISKKQLNSH